APRPKEPFAGDPGVAAGFRGLPHLLAGPLVDREEELPLPGAAPVHAQVTVEDRRGSVAPQVLELADVIPPQFLAIEVITDQAGPWLATTRSPSVTGDAEQNGFVGWVISFSL